MIVDAHAHIGRWPAPQHYVTPDELVLSMRRFGIDYTAISASSAIYYDYREGNREVAEAMQGHPEILGYVTVNLNYLEGSLAELEGYLGRRNPGSQWVGIKVHQQTNRRGFNIPEGMAIAAAAEHYGVPILIHTFSSAVESPWNVVPIAKVHPKAQVILGHMGGDTWWEGALAGREAPNLYLEVCSTYTDPPKFRAAIEAVGAERVLFGTDTTLFEISHLMGAMQDAGLTDEEYRLIMGENARKLFKL